MDTEPYTPSPGAHFEEGLTATAAGTTSVAESCRAPHTPHHMGHEQTQALHLGKGQLGGSF